MITFTNNAYLKMLNDTDRNIFYKNIIAKMKPDYVIDYGCGYPILSQFCLMAGAKKVYAIDTNKNLIPILENFKKIYPNRFEYFITDHNNLPDIRTNFVVSELFAPNLFHEEYIPVYKSLIKKYGDIKFIPSQWKFKTALFQLSNAEKMITDILGFEDNNDWLFDKWRKLKGPNHVKFMYPIDYSNLNFSSTDWVEFNNFQNNSWIFEFQQNEETYIDSLLLNFVIGDDNNSLSLNTRKITNHWGNQFIMLDPKKIKGKTKVQVDLIDNKHLEARWIE